MPCPCMIPPLIMLLPPAATAGTAIGVAIFGAATAMGFGAASVKAKAATETEIEETIANAEAVTAASLLGQETAFEREDITLIFARDTDGKTRVRARSSTLNAESLRTSAKDFAGRIAQHFAYHRLREKFEHDDIHVLDESEDDDGILHIAARTYKAGEGGMRNYDIHAELRRDGSVSFALPTVTGPTCGKLKSYLVGILQAADEAALDAVRLDLDSVQHEHGEEEEHLRQRR